MLRLQQRCGRLSRRSFSSAISSPAPQSSLFSALPSTYKQNSSVLQTADAVVSTLPNGIRVATHKFSGPATTFSVHVNTGSRYEKEEDNGVAHFLEHMFFKGTKSHSRAGIEKFAEDNGVSLNAYTSREHTVFWATAVNSQLKNGATILSDIIQNSLFDQNAIDAEKAVILREAEEVEGMDDETVLDYLHSTAYQGSALGRTILGPKEVISSMTRGQIINYVESTYTADRMVVSVAGNVEHDAVVNLVDGLFKNVRTSPSSPVPMDKSRFVGSDIRYRYDSIPTCSVAIAFEGLPWLHPDSVALMVMQQIIGNYNGEVTGKFSSSSAVSQLAERGLADKLMSFNSQYHDTGLFGSYLVADHHTVEDAVWVLLRSYVELCHNTTDEVVEKAKNALKSTILHGLESSASVAEDVGRQLLVYGKRMSISETFARIDAVDAATVRRVASEVIHDREIAVASKGSTGYLPDYNWLRRRTYLLRY